MQSAVTFQKLPGNRFSIPGDEFPHVMNEVIAVFADVDDVLEKIRILYEALEAPGKVNVDPALIDFLESVCKYSGLSQVVLNDIYLLKTFNARG